jgi:Bifunctional DNA primase/polymerase, N-terminal
MAMHQENITAALALASAGIKIFPAGADKRPLVKGWQEAATCNADQICTWWDGAAALPAIPCGQNNLVVIDCDRHDGGADGVAAFKSLVTAHGGLPSQVPLVKTPNGGLHVYFGQPNGEALGNGRGSLPPGIDVRGAGGFVVGPGARLPDGRGWTAMVGRSPIHDAPPMPQWLVVMLRPTLREEARETNNADTSDDRGRAYAMAALDQVEAELAAAPTGERNERLFKTAFRLATMAARGWLMESEIIETLLRACEGNQYLREHGHRATMMTIESGLHDGLNVPHDDLVDRSDGAAQSGSGNGAGHREQRHKQVERTQRARVTGEWDDPDMSILDSRRGELPDLPIEAFPQSLHRWMLDAARGAGVTVGHIALRSV